MPGSRWQGISFSFSFDQQIERSFDELIHEPWGYNPNLKKWQPSFDVVETDLAYVIEADLPGVLPTNIHVQIEERRLIVRGFRETVEVSRSARCICVERAQGRFTRAFEFETPVDADKMTTQFEHGILRLTIPKRIGPADE